MIEPLYSEFVPVLLSYDLVSRGDGKLGEEVLAKSRATFRRFVWIARAVHAEYLQ